MSVKPRADEFELLVKKNHVQSLESRSVSALVQGAVFNPLSLNFSPHHDATRPFVWRFKRQFPKVDRSLPV